MGPNRRSSLPPGAQPMAPVDCAWLRMDEPGNFMVINGVMFFDGPLDPGRVRQIFRERLGKVPRFCQRAVPHGATRWSWETVDGFDPAEHLEEETLPAPGGEEELQDLVSRRMGEALSPESPLWRVHLVHGYAGGGALIWRLHHCMGDGLALMVLLLALADLERDAPAGSGPMGHDNPLAALFGDEPLSADEARGYLEELLPEGAKLMLKPAEALQAAGRWLTRAATVPAFTRLAGRPPDPKTRLKGKLGGTKRAAWSPPIPLAQVQAARRSIGGTLNDVMIAALAGGLRRYLEGKGDATERLRFRAVVPVSLRPLAEMSRLGNQFGLVFLPLPVGLKDPAERLAELRRRMGALKRSVEPVVVLGLLNLIGRVPKRIQDLVIRIFGMKGTAVLTSVPGPAKTLYLAGRAISGLVFWVPQSGRLALGLSIISYDGQVRLGVAADTAVIPDPEAIVAAFEDELTSLEALATTG